MARQKDAENRTSGTCNEKKKPQVFKENGIKRDSFKQNPKKTVEIYGINNKELGAWVLDTHKIH